MVGKLGRMEEYPFSIQLMKYYLDVKHRESLHLAFHL